MEFHEKLRAIRKAQSPTLTQDQFGKGLGSSYVNIQLYESSKARVMPRGSFMLKLCNKYPQYALWLMTDLDDLNEVTSKSLSRVESQSLQNTKKVKE